ncbi:DUF5708 family protein [Saccharopolyspora shandongensis]|uniref:DUF5708 family protein n=1 Tax=Saccharopolyspora shandongensis TaxID=418495 RepID=UPI0033EB1775
MGNVEKIESGARAARRTLVSGVVLALIGAVLWATTGGVELPVVSLSKVGVVLLVVGAIEIVVGLAMVIGRSVRGRQG